MELCVAFDNHVAVIVDMVVFLRLRQLFVCQKDFILQVNDDMGPVRHGEGHTVAFVLDFFGVRERFFDFCLQLFLRAAQLLASFADRRLFLFVRHVEAFRHVHAFDSVEQSIYVISGNVDTAL